MDVQAAAVPSPVDRTPKVPGQVFDSYDPAYSGWYTDATQDEQTQDEQAQNGEARPWRLSG